MFAIHSNALKSTNVTEVKNRTYKRCKTSGRAKRGEGWQDEGGRGAGGGGGGEVGRGEDREEI